MHGRIVGRAGRLPWCLVSNSPAQPVIGWARRTPVGTAGRALRDCDTTALAAPLVAAAAAATGHVDEVVLGNCLGAGGNVARVAALAAGLTVPATTVDLQCGSGLAAVRQAAALVRSGSARTVLAGGVESASTAPIRTWRESGISYDRAPFAPRGVADPEMGPAADDLARRRGFDRGRLDEWAARSHAATWASVTSGAFTTEILPIGAVSTDDRPRPGLTVERLGRLRPSFAPDGTATAGNSCGISDGAAVVTVSADHRGPGLAILASAVVAGDPALPGAQAGPAVTAALRTAGLQIADLGAVEVTEAFAAVPLALIDDLQLDDEIVCSGGGAIGLGHPWGASGALLLVRLWQRMVTADGPEFGVAVCAVGGGQGIAVLVQRVAS